MVSDKRTYALSIGLALRSQVPKSRAYKKLNKGNDMSKFYVMKKSKFCSFRD